MKDIEHMFSTLFISRCRKGYFQDWHILGKYSDYQPEINNKINRWNELP